MTHIPPSSPRLGRGLALLASGALVLLTACSGDKRTPEEHVQRAKTFTAQGKNQEALIELRNALQQNATHAEANLLMAETYLAMGDPDMAEAAIAKAKQGGVGKEALQPLSARSLLMKNQNEEAIRTATPGENTSQLMRLKLMGIQAQALLRLGKATEACAKYDAMRQTDPNDVPTQLGLARCNVILRQDTRQALADVDSLLRTNSGNADAWLLKGDIAWLEKKQADAETAYQKAIEHNPVLQEAYKSLVMLRLEQRKTDAAQQVADSAGKKLLSSPLPPYLQALVAYHRQRYEQARDLVDQSLKLASGNAQAILLSAAVRYRLGGYEQAASQASQYLSVYRNDIYARKLLAGSQFKLGQTSKALDTLAPILQASNPDQQTLTLAGDIHLQAGDPTKAARYYQQASALSPNDATIKRQLGLSQLARGLTSEGIAQLEQSSQMDAGQIRADYLLVTQYVSQKAYDKALAVVDRMLKKQPGNPATYNLQGFVHLSRKDNPAARRSYEQALAAQPTYEPALLNITQLDISENKLPAARQRLESALGKSKGSTAIMLALADLYALEKNKAGQLKWLGQAADSNPKDLRPKAALVDLHLRAGEPEKALAEARAAASANPGNAGAVELLAKAYAATNDRENLLSALTKLTELQPGSPSAFYRLAMVQSGMGQQGSAKTSLKRALQLQPRHLEANVALALVEQAQGNATTALQMAKNIQKMAPKSSVGHLLEGDLLVGQKRYRDAIGAYDRAMTLAPDGKIVMARHRAQVLAGDTSNADQAVLRWLQSHPADLEARHQYAQNLLAENRHAQAITQYEEILRHSPDNTLALNNLAALYQLANDPRALATAEKAMKLAPENPTVLDTYAWALVQVGQAKKALPLLAKAAEKLPKDKAIRFHHAAALEKSGARDEAKKELLALVNDKTPFPQRNEAESLLQALWQSTKGR